LTGSIATVPALSVMPKVLRTGTPTMRSNSFASSVGSGVPPVNSVRTDEVSIPSRGAFRTEAMIVGTATSVVTRNFATVRQ